jgi:cellobiose transport system substrate-binding protein
MTWTRRGTIASIITLGMAAAALTACSAGGGEGGDGNSLTVWYRPGSLPTASIEGLEQQFPDIQFDVVETPDLDTKLAAALRSNTDVPDITVADVLQYGSVEEKFLDVSEHGFADVADSYLEWKVAAGQSATGRQLGIPIDIGPYGYYYKPADFEAAGLPGDPEAVGEAIATWDGYADALAALTSTGKFGCDHASNVYYYAMYTEGTSFYEGADRTFAPESEANAEAFERAMDYQNDGLCTNTNWWGPEWNSAASQGELVGFLAPPWIGGALQAAAPDQAGLWRVASQTPGGSASENGSTLMISAATVDPDLATEVALWMTNAENQAAGFAQDGLFPSALLAYEMPAMQEPNEYYGDQVVTQVLGDIAAEAPTFNRGPNTIPATNIFRQTITDSIETGASGVEAYETALSKVKSELGG